MRVASAAARFVLLVGCSLWLVGCGSNTSTTLDEQRDPFFLAGKNKVNGLDYAGAIESFEKALEVNPQSASAHYQLGWLYDKGGDYAASIYHYQRYFKILKNKKQTDDDVERRIAGAKEELSKSTGLVSIPSSDQRTMEKWIAENDRLRQQVDFLNKRLVMATNLPARPFPAPVATNVAGPTEASRVPAYPPEAAKAVPTNRPAPPGRIAATPVRPSTSSPKAAPRIHVVRPGESLAVIARKYGVNLAALQAANPRIEPRKLRAGQTVNVPAP